MSGTQGECQAITGMPPLKSNIRYLNPNTEMMLTRHQRVEIFLDEIHGQSKSVRFKVGPTVTCSRPGLATQYTLGAVHIQSPDVNEIAISKGLNRSRSIRVAKLLVLPTSDHITKTHLYIFHPLKPHFYIVKLGFTRVFIIFLISAQNIDCGYSLEPPRRGGSN